MNIKDTTIFSDCSKLPHIVLLLPSLTDHDLGFLKGIIDRIHGIREYYDLRSPADHTAAP